MAVINMLTIPFGALFYERKVPYHCSSCGNKMRLYSTKTSHLIDAPKGRCCAACGYTPIKQDGNTCPLCGRTWEGSVDNG